MQNSTFEFDDPTYIAGDYNLVSGSMYVGSELNTGIELSGTDESVIKTANYQGYDSGSGFMMWSGSNQYDLGEDSIGFEDIRYISTRLQVVKITHSSISLSFLIWLMTDGLF